MRNVFYQPPPLTAQQPYPSAWLLEDARIDPEGPLVAATIGGRPVILARSYEHPMETVPVTVSRLRKAIDTERGMDTSIWRQTALMGELEDDVRGHILIAAAGFGLGMALGMLIGTHR
jgi:hypothetical protein